MGWSILALQPHDAIAKRGSNESLFYFILYGVANREAIVSARDADYHSGETLTNHG